jgi:hypothetical protein
VGAVKTTQSAEFKIAVNTWTCYFKYENPSKFENVEETTIGCLQVHRWRNKTNPHPTASSSPPGRHTLYLRRPLRS